jgi:hypothetical protein
MWAEIAAEVSSWPLFTRPIPHLVQRRSVSRLTLSLGSPIVGQGKNLLRSDLGATTDVDISLGRSGRRLSPIRGGSQ